MTFAKTLTALAVLAALAACGSEQKPAPVEYKGSAPAERPAAAPVQTAAPAAVTPSGAPDPRGVIVYPDYAVIQARSGDTIEAMAGRVGVAPSELAAYNGLPTDYKPLAGDELVLPPRPGGYQQVAAAPASGPISEPLAPAATTAAPATTTTTGGWNPAAISSAIQGSGAAAPSGTGIDLGGQRVLSHQVAPGETVYSIADLYQVSVETLVSWNSLVGPSYTVYPGQILSVPATSGAAPAPAPAAGSVATANLGGALSPSDQPLTVMTLPREAPAPAAPAEVTPLQSPQLGQYQTGAAQTAAPAPAPAPAPVAAAPAAGRLLPPVDGPIVKPYSREAGAARNDGVDFAAREGDAVRAADDGEVALVSRSLGGLGNIILIRHNSEILTVYGRVGDISVAKGARVRRGQEIGKVAPAAAPDQPTVHFEVRRGAVSVDPEEYL